VPSGDDRPAFPSLSGPIDLINLLGFFALTIAFVVLFGRPLATDDTWWHLTFGRHFLTSGPWLEAHPSLFTSVSPPSPASWLSDVGLYSLSLPLGVGGLRLVHVALTILILSTAWLALRRASRGSVGLAATGCASFLVLSAYRLSQLRPELATLLATILLYLLLLQDRSAPSWRRVGGATLLCGVWANLHAAFLLGPVIVGSACGGTVLELLLRGDGDDVGRRPLRARAKRLGWATILTTGATFLNPMGPAAHLLYFRAGQEAPAMSYVADEWAPLHPFRMPVLDMPPTPLVWVAYWLVGITTIGCGVHAWRVWRSSDDRMAFGGEPDGALVALALLGILAPLFAVRFLWLGFFPLLFVAHTLARTIRARLRMAWILAASTWLLVLASGPMGDWPLLSSGVSRETYLDSYDRWKYHDHAVGFLRESGLEGHVFNGYPLGGFLGYWLAPGLRVFIDGSLGVPPEVMTHYLSIQANEAGLPGQAVTDLLDRLGVDAFFGLGFPVLQSKNRPWRFTTRHLDGDRDWVLVFRDLRTAIYLRRNERNIENLRRVAAYYSSQGIPFEEDEGIRVASILDEAPGWAVEHGLVPRDFEQLLRSARSGRISIRGGARLVAVYLALGLEERALEIDDRLIAAIPTASAPRRRRIGALLRLGRVEEAREEADELARLHPDDALALRLIAEARRFDGLSPDQQRRHLSLLPVLSRREARRLRNSILPPAEPRQWPARRG
jgi:hypothetical protein